MPDAYDSDARHAPAFRPRAARWATAAATAWAGVIFGMSSLPGSAVPGKFGTLAHFLEYAVLGALLLAATRRPDIPRGDIVLAVALASAWGVTDELHQLFVTLRVPDHADWLVDTAGALAGAVLTQCALAVRGLDARRQ